MAPSSLAQTKKGRSTSSVKPVSTNSATAQPDSILHQIHLLTSQLPPAAPANSSLNPLADLVALFDSLPLAVPSSAPASHAQLNRQQVHTALHSLAAIFQLLIKQGRLHGTLKAKKQKLANGQVTQEDDSVQAVKQWLNDRYHQFLAKAALVVGNHWDHNVRISALNALMSLLRAESAFLTSLHHSRQAQFPSPTFAHIVRAILVPTPQGAELRVETRDEWLKWFNRDDDVRYHFLKEAASLLTSYTPSASAPSAPSKSKKSAPLPSTPPLPTHLSTNLVTLLEHLTTMPTSPHELNSFYTSTPLILKAPKLGGGGKKRKAPEQAVDDGSTGVFDSSSSESEAEPEQKLSSSQTKKLLPPLLSLSAHKKVFQDCWMALLSLPGGLEESEAKRVLVILHRQVLPHLVEPRRLMDWLVDCADGGGTIGILALNGLFTLMQKHNLEFPDFFAKLYSLLDRDVLHVRYRPRFFRLLDIFMGSSHLPSHLVASFIKRLARLSLSAPPAGIITIIPFIYNMLKRHPGCMVMIHKPKGRYGEEEEADVRGAENDPFLPQELDPLKTNAISSSLWELKALQSHYLASVSGLAKIFGEVMNKQSYAMEDFLDHSYATMFASETSRIIRSAPALAPIPKRQPIGDSFFPAPGSLNAEATVEKVVEKVLTEEGVLEEVVTERNIEPVDVVSRLWAF